MSSNVPTAPLVQAPKPQRSPPSPEELCLRTFKTCWYLDKSWLVDFVASAQRATPSSPVTWVEFMPKGHTHLVRSALKLVPPTKLLPVAKIKEVMFQYILIVLNGLGSSPDFFNARKAAKPRKKASKHGKGGSQLVDMAVDAPPPSDPSPPMVVPGNAPLRDAIVRSALLHPLCGGRNFERPAKQLKSRREYGGNTPIPQFSHF